MNVSTSLWATTSSNEVAPLPPKNEWHNGDFLLVALIIGLLSLCCCCGACFQFMTESDEEGPSSVSTQTPVYSDQLTDVTSPHSVTAFNLLDSAVTAVKPPILFSLQEDYRVPVIV
uniref:Uncharacterized protein n=1 Tax=Plectus sambesii TaxID=2011161 RepID=A0A914V569_9BILA